MDPLKRVNYFAGQLLTVRDFSDEQSYYRKKQRLRNLLVQGYGIVSGLKVSTGAKNGGIRVTPGIAIDRAGNEIIVPDCQILPFPTGLRSVFLTLHYVERPTDLVPIPGSEENSVEATRIEEGFRLEYVPEDNGGKDDSVRLARLCFRRGRWRVEKPRRFQLLTLGAAILLTGLLSQLGRSRDC
ncbi:MAG: hypothetical protein QOE34_2698 [Verrucomicrobiota bacterium]|jgi:hypothetical protein